MGTPLIRRTASWSEVRAALAVAQKSNKNAAAYSRWFNRPFGRLLAATAYRWGVSPNQVTLTSALFTFSGIVMLAVAQPSWWFGFGIAALLVIGYALDSADGQVARLSGGGSPAGEWLDHVIDSFKTATLHLAIAIMWFRNLDDWPVASTLIPLAFAAQQSVWFFTIMLTEQLERAGGTKGARSDPAESASLRNSVLIAPADYGLLCLLFLLLGWFPIWRWIYAALLIYNLALLAVQLVRWYRRIASMPRPESPQGILPISNPRSSLEEGSQ